MGYFKSLLDSFRGIIIEAKRIPLKVHFLLLHYIICSYIVWVLFEGA